MEDILQRFLDWFSLRFSRQVLGSPTRTEFGKIEATDNAHRRGGLRGFGGNPAFAERGVFCSNCDTFEFPYKEKTQ
jgi:hypothetical protein